MQLVPFMFKTYSSLYMHCILMRNSAWLFPNKIPSKKVCFHKHFDFDKTGSFHLKKINKIQPVLMLHVTENPAAISFATASDLETFQSSQRRYCRVQKKSRPLRLGVHGRCQLQLLLTNTGEPALYFSW